MKNSNSFKFFFYTSVTFLKIFNSSSSSKPFPKKSWVCRGVRLKLEKAPIQSRWLNF